MTPEEHNRTLDELVEYNRQHQKLTGARDCAAYEIVGSLAVALEDDPANWKQFRAILQTRMDQYNLAHKNLNDFEAARR